MSSQVAFHLRFTRQEPTAPSDANDVTAEAVVACIGNYRTFQRDAVSAFRFQLMGPPRAVLTPEHFMPASIVMRIDPDGQVRLVPYISEIVVTGNEVLMQYRSDKTIIVCAHHLEPGACELHIDHVAARFFMGRRLARGHGCP